MRQRIVFGAQMTDLGAFLLAVGSFGIGGESNLAMAALGIPGVVAAKTAGAVLLSVIAPRVGRWWIVPAIAGLVGAATAIRCFT